MPDVKTPSHAAARAPAPSVDRRNATGGTARDEAHRPGYMVQLDGLRGIAVGLVLLHHFPPNPVLQRVVPFGHIGVQLFFVLSGFLITGILLTCKTKITGGDTSLGQVVRGFYGRRALRIFPVFYLTLLVLWICDVGQARQALPYHATYLTNFKMVAAGKSFGTTTHFWSLAVEEQFYLLWPWVVLLTPRRRLLVTCIGVALLAPVFRTVVRLQGWDPGTHGWLPFDNLDALCGGAALAVMMAEPAHRSLRHRVTTVGLWLGGIGSLCYVVAGFAGVAGDWIRIAGPGICMSLLLVAVVDRAAAGVPGIGGRFLEWRPLVHLGKVSYCVYVVHYFLPELVDPVLLNWSVEPLTEARDPVVRFVVMSLLAIGIASLSYRWLEGPALRLKHRFPYAKRSTGR